MGFSQKIVEAAMRKNPVLVEHELGLVLHHILEEKINNMRHMVAAKIALELDESLVAEESPKVEEEEQRRNTFQIKSHENLKDKFIWKMHVHDHEGKERIHTNLDWNGVKNIAKDLKNKGYTEKNDPPIMVQGKIGKWKWTNIKREEVEPVKEETENVQEANVQRIGRLKLIRIRIRNGKIQRRKKLSAVKGYTLRGGRLQRMTAMERRHRKLGARRAKIKRRSERARIRIKTRRSLRKRKALGL